MIVGILLIALCLTQIPSLAEFHDSGCGIAHCNACWKKDGVEKCEECEKGYMFDYQMNKVDTSADEACHLMPEYKSDIAGYGRDCAECGYYNYLNTDLNTCDGCKVGCDECKHGTGECTKCHDGDALEYNVYTVVSGQCTCPYGEMLDYECKCNDQNHYLNYFKECTQCDDCARNYTNCKNVPIRQHYYDDDTEDCPIKCFIGCEECNGPRREQCTVDTVKVAAVKRLCRNDLGWEEVKLGDVLSCLCVCYSHEILDSASKDSMCVCEEGRELVDKCAMEGATCDDAQKLYSYQCVCKGGLKDGDRLANGLVPCV